MADFAPMTTYANQLKSPRPDSKAPKPRKKPMPGSVATLGAKPAKSSKAPEPMAIARMIKMVAGAGGR
jgi:hypothetical protein